MNSQLCFATLAFGKTYRDMAKLLAADLATFAPDHALVIATDAVEDFKNCDNVFAFHQERVGFFRCINDKRFAVQRALDRHADEVLFIDADSRAHHTLPTKIGSDAKFVTTFTPPLVEQVSNYLLPEHARAVLAAARSFGVDPGKTKFVMDSIYSVKRDRGREKIFVQVWDLVTRLLDFEGASVSDGFCMAIAAAVAGWEPSDTGMELFAQALHHDEVSRLDKTPGPLARGLRRGVTWSQWMLYRQRVIRSIKIPATVA